jgi:hypothetical protein
MAGSVCFWARRIRGRKGEGLSQKHIDAGRSKTYLIMTRVDPTRKPSGGRRRKRDSGVTYECKTAMQ